MMNLAWSAFEYTVCSRGNKQTTLSEQKKNIKDIHLANMAWWLKSAGALNFALSQE